MVIAEWQKFQDLIDDIDVRLRPHQIRYPFGITNLEWVENASIMHEVARLAMAAAKMAEEAYQNARTGAPDLGPE